MKKYKAIIAFIMCIGVSLLMVSCSTAKRDVPFQCYSLEGRNPDNSKFIIYADSSFKAGDTIHIGWLSAIQVVLIQRVK